MPKNFDRSKAQIGVWSYMGRSNITPGDMRAHTISSENGDFLEIEKEARYVERRDVEPLPQQQARYQKKKSLKPSNSNLILERIHRLKQRRAGGETSDLREVEINISEEGEEESFEHPIEAQAGESKLAANSYLSHDDSNPIKIMLEIDDQYGKDWLNWEPETFIQSYEKDGVTLSKLTMDKIMALKVIINTEEFFESARVFEKICVAFSNRMVDWGVVQNVRVHDIAATVAVILRFLKDEPFSDDVKGYIAASAVRDGYMILPEVLKFATEPFMEQVRKNIGTERQEELLMKIDSADKDNLTEDESVQLLRMVRCQRHVAEKINEVFDE